MAKDQELEIKYFVKSLEPIRLRLELVGGKIIRPRVHEINYRFDTPERRLEQSFQVLRLRKDNEIRMTFKGPAIEKNGVRVRQEIEFKVNELRSAQALLEALDFQIVMMYEKYRTEYSFEECHIALDELPFGLFVEIEGPDPTQIRAVNQLLGLDWDSRVSESYVILFDRIKQVLNLKFRDLTFENFQQFGDLSRELNVNPADQN